MKALFLLLLLSSSAVAQSSLIPRVQRETMSDRNTSSIRVLEMNNLYHDYTKEDLPDIVNLNFECSIGSEVGPLVTLSSDMDINLLNREYFKPSMSVRIDQDKPVNLDQHVAMPRVGYPNWQNSLHLSPYAGKIITDALYNGRKITLEVTPRGKDPLHYFFKSSQFRSAWNEVNKCQPWKPYKKEDTALKILRWKLQGCQVQGKRETLMAANRNEFSHCTIRVDTNSTTRLRSAEFTYTLDIRQGKQTMRIPYGNRHHWILGNGHDSLEVKREGKSLLITTTLLAVSPVGTTLHYINVTGKLTFQDGTTKNIHERIMVSP